MQSEGDFLWESFPWTLESQEGVRRYINAFHAPFQELPSLSPQQVYTLKVCSLLVIPPPIGRTVPQGGFPSNLSKLNLSRWADLVQEVAAGLWALPSRLHLDLGTLVISLLQLLEVSTGVGFCHHCCHPGPHCTCMEASQLAPSMSWSQVVQQTPGYGVTSTSGGATNMSTPVGGIPGYVAPPPGLTLTKFLNLEYTPSRGPSTPRATGIPITLASHGEDLATESCGEPAGSDAVDSRVAGCYFAESGAEGYGATGSYTVGSKIASLTATGSSDGATLALATPLLQELAINPLSAGGAATSQAQGERSHLQCPH